MDQEHLRALADRTQRLRDKIAHADPSTLAADMEDLRWLLSTFATALERHAEGPKPTLH